MYLQSTDPSLSQVAADEAADNATENNAIDIDSESHTPDGDGTAQVTRPHPPQPPPLFTPNEWLSPPVILKQLPSDLTEISFGVELAGSDEDLLKHLREVPDWEKLEAEFMRFPKLQHLRFHRLGDAMNADHAEWSKAGRAFIINKFERLVRRKVLELK